MVVGAVHCQFLIVASIASPVRLAKIFFSDRNLLFQGGVGRGTGIGERGGLSEQDAFETLKQALPYYDKFIGIGLDSSELGNPPEKFARVFSRAREFGFHVVAHAGEEGPPSYIQNALDRLLVERIDHGVRCLEDADLTQRLVKSSMPLTVCPLSNLKLRVVENLKDHNILQLLDAGVMATINSDDPAYFGGYINDNFVAVVDALPMSLHHAKQLAYNSFGASFLDDESKQFYLTEVDAFFNSH